MTINKYGDIDHLAKSPRDDLKKLCIVPFIIVENQGVEIRSIIKSQNMSGKPKECKV